MHITIEPVKTSETEQLAIISRETFYDTFHAQNTKEDMEQFLQNSFNVQKLTEELQDDRNFFFFAKINNQIAGYLKLSVSDCPTELKDFRVMELSRIYVDKNYVGKGVGKALMQFALRYANENNKEIVYLGVWEHNERAIHFYKNYGFEKFSEHTFMVGQDPQVDWLMKKNVK